MGGVWGLLAGFGAWNWLILGAVLLAMEAVAPGMHIVWFGIAALAVGALALMVPFAWQGQVLLFLAIAVALVLIARRFFKAGAGASDQPALNQRAAQYLGQSFEVAEAITGGRGRIRVGDTLWQAEGPDAPEGAYVKVTGARGTVLLVDASRG